MLNQKTIPSLRTGRVLVGLAVLSYIPTLFLPYTGEEGVYTITSLEMAHRGEWLVPTLYGNPYPRPPLVNWLMIPIAGLLGWEHILPASRLITAAATAGTGLLLIAVVLRLYRDRHLAVLSGLFFFSGDILFNRGWMAYADPLFSFFIFLALASLLLAVYENRPWLLAGVLIGLVGSFMSKALTGYVFYGITLMVVVAIEKDKRGILWSPLSILVHALAVAYPFFWWSLVEHGPTMSGMLGVMMDKMTGGGAAFSIWSYIEGRFAFLGETFLCLLPGSVLILFLIIKARGVPSLNGTPLGRVITWLVVLNVLPYLLAPSTNARYLLPLFPWCALLFALLLARSTTLTVGPWIYNLFGLMIALKFVAGIWLFSWYEMNHRSGDFRQAAQHIVTRTQGHPLYVVDFSYLGLSLTAHINVLRLPDPPLTWPDQGWRDGFVLAREYHFPEMRVVDTYEFARDRLYLRCRGEACPQAAP